jgi:DNA repair photolyase
MGTPIPEERLKTVRNLIEIGILPEIRIDPIIPFITDTEGEAMTLFGQLREVGVKRVTLSYLHLRPAIHNQLKEELPPLHRRVIESCFKIQEYSRVEPSVRAKLLPRVLRQTGYRRIKEIAERFEIAASICRCKNPDLEADLCGSGRIRADLREGTTGQLPLFQC